MQQFNCLHNSSKQHSFVALFTFSRCREHPSRKHFHRSRGENSPTPDVAAFIMCYKRRALPLSRHQTLHSVCLSVCLFRPSQEGYNKFCRILSKCFTVTEWLMDSVWFSEQPLQARPFPISAILAPMFGHTMNELSPLDCVLRIHEQEYICRQKAVAPEHLQALDGCFGKRYIQVIRLH